MDALRPNQLNSTDTVRRQRQFFRLSVASVTRMGMAAVLSLALSCGALFSSPAPAQASPLEITIDGMVFQADSTDPEHGATLVSCPSPATSTSISIPTKIDFGSDLPYYTVYEIAPRACMQRGLVSVELPVFVHDIGDYAFFENELTSIDLPWPVENIGDFAFTQNKLQSLDLTQARLDSIGEGAFENNQIAGDVTVPAGLERLGNGAFRGNSISSVSLPDSISVIPNGLFDRNKLTEVSLPSSVVTVEPWAFGENSISKLTLPNSLKRLEAVAFARNSLTEVTIPASVDVLQGGVFGANPNLTTIVFEGNAPQGVVNASGNGSFGTADGKTVHIHRSATGFATPPELWEGYSLQYLENYVSFDTQGGSVVPRQTVEYGKTATTPASPSRSGFGFTGWFTDAQSTHAYDFSTPVTDNVTLYAGWSLNTYDVTFDSQGGSAVAASTVDHGKPVASPADPTREGHTFTGWYTDKDTKNKYDFATPVTGALTLYAGWKIDTYTVTFDSQGGSAVASSTVDHGKAVEVPAEPAREGYAFTGWYTDKDATTKYDFATPVTGALTLYAGWSLNTYDVTFDSQGGTAVAKSTVDHGKPVASPADPTREGHTFTGWYTDKDTKNKYDFATPVTGALTLYAGWKIDTYTVTFDSQGGSAVASSTVDHGKAVEVPAEPAREGYAFTGWYTDKDATTKYDFATPVTGALTLYAGWSLNTYDVTFDSQGGTAVAKSTVDHGKPVASPADPTREGHTFTGWYTDKDTKNKYDFATPVTGALTLYAGWKIDTYTVTFDSQGGSAVASSTVDHGKAVEVPAEPAREGYAFTGWYTDKDATTKYDFATPVTGALTLYAGWSLNTYDVTFDSQGGTAVAKSTVDHGKPVASPADPTREGHTFTGWYTDKDTKNKYDFATPVTGALTLYAGWKIDTYTVTFDSQGGSAVASSTVDHGKAVEVPAEPNKKGHTFTGWYTDADATSVYDFDAPITASVTLFAGWTVDTYVMTFATHGGSEVASVTVAYGELLPEPAAPTREHYSFAGWYTDAETTIAYDFATPVSGPVTLHAAWKIDTVSVTFDTRGGSATKAETIDYGSRLVVPSTPQRDGYVFTGWHTDEAATVKYNFSSPVTEPFTLYAGWKAIEGNAGANGGDSNGKGDATGTRPTSPGGLTNTGSNGVPMGVFIGIGAIVILGAGLAFMGIRKRRQASTDDVSTDGENTDSL